MTKDPVKNPFLPWTAAAALYLLLALALYYQLVFLPMTLSAPDSLVPLASSIALDRLRDASGQYPLWQPWTFAGMPTVEAFSYLGGLYYPNIVFSRLPFGDIGSQILHLCFAGIGGYALLRSFRLHHAAAFLGGAAFMLNPYMTAMLVHGHGSQLMTAAYMPWVLRATLRVFDTRGSMGALNTRSARGALGAKGTLDSRGSSGALGTSAMLDTRAPELDTRASLGTPAPDLGTRALLGDAGMLAILLGFQLQRAHVQIAWYTWLLMGLLALVLLFSAHRTVKESLKRAGFFATACVVGIAISAAVYLPASEYAAYSVRGAAGGGGAAMEYATMWSMHPVELLTFLVPGLYGFGGVTYWGFMPFTDFPHYAGIVVLLLAFAGFIARRRDPFVLFLGGSTLLALLISFGSFFSPVFDLFYNFAPLFSRFRVPSMVLIVAELNLSLLAGFGLHWLLDAPEKSLRIPLKVLAVVSALSIVLILLGGEWFEGFFRSIFPPPPVENFDLAFMVNKVRWEGIRDSVVMSGLFAALVAGLAWPGMRKFLSGSKLASVIVVLAIGDLLLLNAKIVSPPEASLRPPVLVQRQQVETALASDDVTGFLASQKGPFRIYPVGPLFGENKFALSGIESVGGYHPAKLRNYEEFLRRTENLSSLAALRMLNVRYVVSPAEVQHPDLEPVKQGTLRLVSGDVPAWVYRLKANCPRAWFATTVTGLSSRDDLFTQVLQDGSNCRSVYVDGAEWQGSRRFAEGTIQSMQRTAESMTLKVSAPSEAFLVTSEIFYPLRWQAILDGRPAFTKEVNGLIRGVQIPAGEHELTFTYDRSDFDKGRYVSLAAFGVAVVMVAGGVVAGRAGGKKKQDS
ncbi:MAG: YfhO family protein [Chlorobi bacterium]|nr:YfhO family protein [Chlorobiota bacterium]